MMGRGGGRSMALLGCVAILLVISSSAVSGDVDDFVRDFRKFGARLGRERLGRGAIPAHEEAGKLDVDAVPKPADGISEKARSFLSGLAGSIGDGISHPASFVSGREPREKTQKKFGRRGHVFGPPYGRRHSHWAGIRGLIRNHPERIAAAADISGTEPLVLEEDATPVTPGPELFAKIAGIVTTVVEEYDALADEPNLESSCIDFLEEQVKLFVKSVKTSLRERLCNGEGMSVEEEAFCNIFNDHPSMGTFQSIWMANVNPVEVSWRHTSKNAACSSVNPLNSFLDSLEVVEALARQFSGVHLVDTPLEDKHVHRRFCRQKHEERGWLRRNMTFCHVEEKEMFHKHMKPHHFEKRHEHEDHEQPWWQRLFHIFHKHKQMIFGMFRKPKQMRHQVLERTPNNAGKDLCFYKNVKHLSRGIRQHLARSCESTAAPNVTEACKFAKEHHFLVKVWLAVKMPVWSRVAKHCALESEHRHAPNLGVRRAEIERTNHFVVDDLASNEAEKTNERQLNSFPHGMSTGCTRQHAKRGLSKALHLRGHVIGVNHGENGLEELVRTHLIVLRGHPLRLPHFEDALESSKPFDHSSSEEMLTYVQDRLSEFIRDSASVRDAVSGEHRDLPGLQTELMVFKPFHQHADFHMSANTRAVPTSNLPHFRISARPRVVRDANNEIPVVVPDDINKYAVGEVVKLGDKNTVEMVERRADM